jgi:hypothetical protein
MKCFRVVPILAAALTVGAACDRAPDKTADTGSPAPVAQASNAPNPSTDSIYMCPMDKDIRGYGPGKCPRCGMQLVTSIPDPAEYHLHLSVSPPPLPGKEVQLRFEVSDPWKNNPVTKFAVIHEKLFHAFVVSQDLEFFVHGHPEWHDGSFTYDVKLPKPGMYRVLGDFYPEAATPQLITQTVFVPGDAPAPAAPTRDYSAKQAENLTVAMTTSPEAPVAGVSARLRFTLAPDDHLERYLGVWAHMLAVSDDLIDMMHMHPSIADGRHELQFDVVFPRPRVYRIWVQFQRAGIVNTARFDVPVQVSHGASPSGAE